MWWISLAMAVEPRIDGDLSEWASVPPRWTLSAAEQVAGASKVRNDEDLTAKIWVQFTSQGMVIAGDVIDDQVRLPKAVTDIHLDHPEIWLSLPGVGFGPIGFANQFGETTLESAEDCDNTEISIEDSAACKSWFKEQVRYRGRLGRMFTRQWVITPYVAELWASSAGEGVPMPNVPTGGRSVLTPNSRGYTFEVLLPISDFPATTGMAISEVWVMVDIVDNDDGSKKQESFLSSSPRRKMGDPSTFTPWELQEPLPLAGDAFTVALLRSLVGIPGASSEEARLMSQMVRYPGAPKQGYLFWNEPMGYQYQPKESSPSIIPVDLTFTPVDTFGEWTIYQGPASFSLFTTSFAWVAKVSAIRSVVPFEFQTLESKGTSGPVWRGIFRDAGIQSALGTGACGACPVDYVGVLQVTSDGTASVHTAEFAYERSYDLGGYVEDAAFTVAPDLASFQWTGTVQADAPKPVTERWILGADGVWKPAP